MPPRRRNRGQLNGQELPLFTSSPDEIRRAVERGAIHKGTFLIKVIVSLRIDELLEKIKAINYDREDIYERRGELNIDEWALRRLDNANPSIAYPFYFSTPAYLIEQPELIMYYRNVAMLSKKVMNGIGLNTVMYEDRGRSPAPETALELARYFNGIISKLINVAGVTANRHLEMALSNIGEALGGISRNEVGRFVAAQILHYLILHWHGSGYVQSIHYTLKQNFNIEEENEDNVQNIVLPQTLLVTPDMDIQQFLSLAEANRVKYQKIILRNGYHLLLDRQLFWQEPVVGGKTHRIGPDMISKSDVIDMEWAAEIKGGADPAGSDEHWKTATKALDRVLEAANKTGRPQPKLSFLATILVDRVAIEAQRWIDEGKLTSVYNLTKISENEEELRLFLNAMTRFLGYDDT